MDVQPADLAYRRRVVRTLIAVALLLVIIFVAFQFWIRGAADTGDIQQLATRFARIRFTCGTLIAICVAAIGVHLLLRGKHIVAERRFPPRDVRSVRATTVREGEAAVRMGRSSQIAGVATLIAALLVAAWAWLASGIG